MDRADIAQAVALLAHARQTGELLEALPASCRPRDVPEAHAIQDALVAALGERVAGWKVGARQDGKVVRGAIVASRVIASGGSIASSQVPLRGVEAEIAFRFERDLPARERAYDYEEVASAVVALPAIEIVDSRYRDYQHAPFLERVADFVSNGAFVHGAPQSHWREFDLANLDARLEFDGALVVRRTGGHPAGDPLLPAVDLVNDLRLENGVRAGTLMTTGTFTGFNIAKPGQHAKAVFEGFGSAEVTFAA